MAFTVETGAGLTNSNAFVSVAAFKAYCDDRGVDYSGYSDPEIEQAIVRATDFMSKGFDWRGFKRKDRQDSAGEQALAWPRLLVVDADGYDVASNIVPTEVKHATIEVAKYEIANPDAMAAVYVPHDRVKAEKVGPLSVEYDVSRRDAAGARPVLLRVIDLIGELTNAGSGSRLSGESAR